MYHTIYTTCGLCLFRVFPFWVGVSKWVAGDSKWGGGDGVTRNQFESPPHGTMLVANYGVVPVHAWGNDGMCAHAALTTTHLGSVPDGVVEHVAAYRHPSIAQSILAMSGAMAQAMPDGQRWHHFAPPIYGPSHARWAALASLHPCNLWLKPCPNGSGTRWLGRRCRCWCAP